jgi:hypothetical protein
MSPGYRWTLKWCRLAHLYVTLFGLALILFFAVTGFMLNHEDWFGLNEPREWTTEASLPTRLLAKPVDRLAVVELLRAEHGAVGAMTLFNDEGDDELEVGFSGAGRSMVATINREDGSATLRHRSSGVMGLITDLHKGKNTGFVWSLAIDAACVLLLVIAVTGIVLWSSLKGRGKWGVALLFLGTLAGVAAYYFSVP